MNKTKELREALKRAGYNRNYATVRAERGGWERSLIVTVRGECTPKDVAEITQIAQSFRSVRYCEVTQETLLGGNTYVTVEKHPDLIENWAKDWIHQTNLAAARAMENPGDLIPIGDSGFMAEKDSDGRSQDFTLWSEKTGHVADYWIYQGDFRPMAVQVFEKLNA
jgi:hypothetical protein